MNYLDYLQCAENVTHLELLYRFGVISEARYTHSQILLAYIDLRKQQPQISDYECVVRLAQNPRYALSEDSISRVIKWSKKQARIM